jgi:hypothetical protein
MKNFVVYKISSGVIVKVGRCSDFMLKYQTGLNEKVLEGVAKTDGSQVVAGGIVIDTPGWVSPMIGITPELSPTISDLIAVSTVLDVAVIKLATIETGADITINNTAAGIVGQGALAVKDGVDLSTSEVTNKSLENLDSAAAAMLLAHDRVYDPNPAFLDVTFSGITACGTGTVEETPLAISANKKFTLPKTSPPSRYELVQDGFHILVEMSETTGTVQILSDVVGRGIFYSDSTPVVRGGTVSNTRVLGTCEIDLKTIGYGGSCFIN